MFVGEVDAASLKIWEANVAAHEYGMSLLKPGASCAEVTAKINAFFEERQLLQYRTFGYGHSFGVLSHYYGREAGLELREDIDTVLEPGMVISMEPMLTIPEGQPVQAVTANMTSCSSRKTATRISPNTLTARVQRGLSFGPSLRQAWLPQC